MLQYDIDTQGAFAHIFKRLRKIILFYPQIKELKNAKQTSYYDEYGVMVMLRSRADALRVSFGRGMALQEKFPILKGSGKNVRYIEYQNISQVDESVFKAMLEESIILGLEAYERKLLKTKTFKPKNREACR